MALNITIIGLDLLGGSLGLALGTLDQEALPTGRPAITGWDDDKRTLQDARGRLMIDRAARDLADAVRDADIVVVNVPFDDLAATFDGIARHLKYGAIVTDTLGSKAQVLALAEARLPRNVDFIGGHALLSHAEKRPTKPSIDLFKGAIYCLVAGTSAQPNALNTLDLLVTAIGAKPYYIDAVEHDAYIAGVDHLPQIVATALMETLSRSRGWREMQPIAGAAFGAMTELAASDPAASRALCQSNSEAIERWINDLIRTLVELRDTLQHGEQLEAIFAHARDAHAQWMTAQPHMRPGESDFYGQNEPEIDRGLGALFFGRRKPRGDRER
ncbi:MAG TPA: prephenate dehydrogenase [Herpetosiphonaceae bacterium]